MGLFDWMTGTKRPDAGVAPKSEGDVRAAIMAVNRDTAPFTVRDGSDEDVDFVAEWRIVDAQWYEIFAKAGLEKVFKVKMRLDPENHEVRAVDEDYTVEWRAGVPKLTLSVEGFRGQKKEISFGQAFGYSETTGLGTVYKYKFVSAEIKDPLQEAVTGAGWTWKGVAFGKL